MFFVCPPLPSPHFSSSSLTCFPSPQLPSLPPSISFLQNTHADLTPLASSPQPPCYPLMLPSCPWFSNVTPQFSPHWHTRLPSSRLGIASLPVAALGLVSARCDSGWPALSAASVPLPASRTARSTSRVLVHTLSGVVRRWCCP